MPGPRNETEKIHRIPPPFSSGLLLEKTKSLPTWRDFSTLFVVWKSKTLHVHSMPSLQGAGSDP